MRRGIRQASKCAATLSVGPAGAWCRVCSSYLKARAALRATPLVREIRWTRSRNCELQGSAELIHFAIKNGIVAV